MKNGYRNTCCFFGHRKIDETADLTERLTKTIEALIMDKDVNTFLFGSKSDFDSLCHKIVSELKEKYPYIKRIYVRAEFTHIDEGYRAYLLKKYEDTYYPERIINAGKAAYVERNYEMIDKSKYCVFYYNDDYAPTTRNRKRVLSDYQPKSGTKIAYDYALKKSKEVFNTFKK